MLRTPINRSALSNHNTYLSPSDFVNSLAQTSPNQQLIPFPTTPAVDEINNQADEVNNHQDDDGEAPGGNVEGGDGSSPANAVILTTGNKRQKREIPQVDYEEFRTLTPLECFKKLLELKNFGIENNRLLKALRNKDIIGEDFEEIFGLKMATSNKNKKKQCDVIAEIKDVLKMGNFHAVLQSGNSENLKSLTVTPSFFWFFQNLRVSRLQIRPL
jgi:hypothetical protein